MYGPNDDVPTCRDCGEHHPTVPDALACDRFRSLAAELNQLLLDKLVTVWTTAGPETFLALVGDILDLVNVQMVVLPEQGSGGPDDGLRIVT